MSFLDDFQRMVHEYPEKTAIVDFHSIRQFEPAEYQEAEHAAGGAGVFSGKRIL